ncbi:MAG: GTPase Era [Desulfovibrio sp.]|jgi:GTP-binding protein Era|nr:GTPase Era [Desulfovibrio sp.]
MKRKGEHRCGRIAILGPPNAGKSTLLNGLLGRKVAIVTPRPQTTRNQIVGILTRPDAQLVFMDTPGLTQTRGRLSKTMIQAVWQSLEQADVTMPVVDAVWYLRHPELLEKDLEPALQALGEDTRPMVLVVNKVDLVGSKGRLLPLMEKLQALWPRAELFPASALTGDGLPQLASLLAERLPPGPPCYPPDQLSTSSLRFLVAEIVREKVFCQMRQEVPYGTAVEVEKWEEFPLGKPAEGAKKDPDPGKDAEGRVEPGDGEVAARPEEEVQTIIHAVIYVARPQHKAMVIGKGGEGIKRIGSQARQDILELIGGKVHLELWVKVRERWTEDDGFLRRLGSMADPVVGDGA